MNRNVRGMQDSDLVQEYESSFQLISDHVKHLSAVAIELVRRSKTQTNPAIHTAARAGVRLFGAVQRSIGNMPRMTVAAEKDRREKAISESEEALRKQAMDVLAERRRQRSESAAEQTEDEENAVIEEELQKQLDLTAVTDEEKPEDEEE